MQRKKKIKQRPIKDKYIDVSENYPAVLEQELKRKAEENNREFNVEKERWRLNLN